MVCPALLAAVAVVARPLLWQARFVSVGRSRTTAVQAVGASFAGILADAFSVTVAIWAVAAVAAAFGLIVIVRMPESARATPSAVAWRDDFGQTDAYGWWDRYQVDRRDRPRSPTHAATILADSSSHSRVRSNILARTALISRPSRTQAFEAVEVSQPRPRPPEKHGGLRVEPDGFREIPARLDRSRSRRSPNFWNS